MKRCPACRRVETDEALSFCRSDGTALVHDSSSFNEAGTVQLGPPSATEAATTILTHNTNAAIPRGTGPTTVLPADAPAAPSTTRTSHKNRYLALTAVVALLLLTIAIGVYAIYSKRNSPSIQSIAVLPFVNTSGNPDVEYLSDGMTESLIGGLSQLPNLNVKARSSVFRYKGKEFDLPKIGQELKVQAILTGRVAQRGDQLTLSLELVDAQTENAIWSQQYIRSQGDIVGLQAQIARDVSNNLRAKLSGAEEAKVTKNHTANPEAYQLYLKGRFLWNKRTAESLKQANEFFKQAILKDPNYALSYASLAETYVLFPIYSIATPHESMPKAKAMALKALELDPSLAEAHVALGFYLCAFEWDRKGAEREYRRAIELNPNYATAHHWLGNEVLATTKRFDEALAEMRIAQEIDPLSAIIGTNLGDVFVYKRQPDEAIAEYRKVLAFDPNFAFAHFALGWAYSSKKMYEESVSALRKSLELSYDPSTKEYLAMALAKTGQREEANKLLGELKQEKSERYVISSAIAVVHLGLDEKDEALNWLEKDLEERSSYTMFMAVDPLYDELRSHPQFKEMLRRLNLPE